MRAGGFLLGVLLLAPAAWAKDSLPKVDPRAAARGFEGAPPAPPAAESAAPPAERRSKWSNEGAEEPVPSPVPITAPLPERSRRPAGAVETPGQARVDDGDLLSVRVALSGYGLTTSGQDLVYADALDGEGRLVRRDETRDIALLRARLSMAYERIAGSRFSAWVDAELRPHLAGPGRPNDQRVNEAFVAWGLTRRQRHDSPDFGVALGRVSVAEAGGARADGLMVRWRPLGRLGFGLFGGVTGNPYGYNWRLQQAETFSADWWTAGAFGRWRGRDLQVALAGVITTSRVPRPPPDPGDMDRVYLNGDVSWQPGKDWNVRARGTFDLLPDGQLIQSARLGLAWSPGPFRVNLSVGRASTLFYVVSSGYSFSVDPLGNRYEEDGLPIVGPDGAAVVPFDAARLVAVYDEGKLSFGWRLDRRWDVFAQAYLRLRGTEASEQAAREALASDVALADTIARFSGIRLLPSVGARFSDPAWVDASVRFTAVVDDRSQADAIVYASVGRQLVEGLRLMLDGRWVAGEIAGLDGGATLGYVLPRDWTPGRFSFRLSYRYFNEAVSLERPASDEQTGVLPADAVRAVIPVQESHLGFFGLEWRL